MAAHEKFHSKDVNRFLRERGVTQISAGLDELPRAYKNIQKVMAAQQDLVTVLGRLIRNYEDGAERGAAGGLKLEVYSLQYLAKIGKPNFQHRTLGVRHSSDVRRNAQPYRQ